MISCYYKKKNRSGPHINKKVISLALTIIITISVFSVFCVGSFAYTAAPTASTVLVDGKNVAFGAYNIFDNNYFKLRDLAYALNGSSKQFEVGWDSANNAISITSGKPYTATGGELAIKDGGAKEAAPTDSKVYLDGREVRFTAYLIDGNNYFKLRDISEALNFKVKWDGERNTIVIDTNAGSDNTITTAWIGDILQKPSAEAIELLEIIDDCAISGIGADRYYVPLFVCNKYNIYIAFTGSQFELPGDIIREEREPLYVIPMDFTIIRFSNGFAFHSGYNIQEFKAVFGDGEYETYSNLKGDKQTYHLEYFIDDLNIEFSSYNEDFSDYLLTFSISS